VLGSQDLSNAPNQANAYYEAITSTKNLTCVTGAPHSIPDSLAGAKQIANDLIASCKPAVQQ